MISFLESYQAGLFLFEGFPSPRLDHYIRRLGGSQAGRGERRGLASPDPEPRPRLDCEKPRWPIASQRMPTILD